MNTYESYSEWLCAYDKACRFAGAKLLGLLHDEVLVIGTDEQLKLVSHWLRDNPPPPALSAVVKAEFTIMKK